jgi:branched-subunit amino acid ABC-type transport system permease component
MPCRLGRHERVTGAATTVITDPGLFLNAVVGGLFLGGFYAAVAIGLSIAFGQLDIVNIAHPAFIIIGSYFAYLFGARSASIPCSRASSAPVFFVRGSSSTASTTPASSAPVKKL